MYFATFAVALSFALSVSAGQGTPVATNAQALATTDPRVAESNAKPKECFSTAMQIPACGHGCMEQAQMSVGCSPVDFTCGCTQPNPNYIRNNAIQCVLSQCGIAQAIQVQINAEEICKCAGLPMPDFSTTSAAPVGNTTSYE